MFSRVSLEQFIELPMPNPSPLIWEAAVYCSQQFACSRPSAASGGQYSPSGADVALYSLSAPARQMLAPAAAT
jgi:hypothetical protein